MLIRYELEQMSRYLDIVQASISQRLDEVEISYQEDIARAMSEEERYQMEDSYVDDFIEGGSNFPRLLLSSFIVAWYSFIEQTLIDICERLKLRISVSPIDKRNLDKGIRRARTFLLDVIQYEILPRHWQELVDIGRLRNFIIHEGTRINGSYIKSNEKMLALQSDLGNTFYFSINPMLFQYIQKNKLYNHSGMFLEIIPTLKYCDNLVEFGKELFERLCEDLKLCGL